MDLNKTWEHFFPDAILSVEELLNSGDASFLGKSKLRIALENKFITWVDYKTWATNHFGVPVLEPKSASDLQKLKTTHLENKEHFTHLNLSEDFLPLQNWDGSILVFGLEYSQSLKSIPGHIFVLCSPEHLEALTHTYVTPLVLEDEFSAQDATENIELEMDSNGDFELPAGLFSDDTPQTPEVTAPPKLSVVQTKNEVVAEIQPSLATEVELEDTSTNTIFKTKEASTYQVWNKITEQHQNFSEIARKNFDAYVVLRINSEEKTELYKMDEDLEKEDLNATLFSYDLKTENPFQNVYTNHFSETFNINQLGLKILDFKYACISAIKLGPKVVGFLVGFKTTNLSQDDISTLESISEKAV